MQICVQPTCLATEKKNHILKLFTTMSWKLNFHGKHNFMHDENSSVCLSFSSYFYVKQFHTLSLTIDSILPPFASVNSAWLFDYFGAALWVDIAWWFIQRYEKTFKNVLLNSTLEASVVSQINHIVKVKYFRCKFYWNSLHHAELFPETSSAQLRFPNCKSSQISLFRVQLFAKTR